MTTALTTAARDRGAARGLRRLLWSALARLPEFRITRRTRHGVLGFSSRDRGVGRILFMRGEYEYEQLERAVALGGFASRGRGWLLDVGANVGTVCIALARTGAFARALAVEPAPATFRHLVKNVARNRLAHAIRCANVALSATGGTAELELSTNSGDHRVRVAGPLTPERYHEHRRPLVRVPRRRLDDLLDEHGIAGSDVGLLWMDVQGHEQHVLDGAPELLASGVPVVVELWPYGLRRAGVEPEAFVEYLGARFRRYYDLGEEAPSARSTAELRALLGRLSHYKSFADLLLMP
jgi:FkbM family methyltransferase